MSKKKEFKNADSLCMWLMSRRPDYIKLVKDKERYDNALKGIQTICNFAVESNPDGTTLEVSQDDIIGTTLTIEIVSDLLIFDDITALIRSMAGINTDEIICEICSRTNGKFSLSVSFQDVFDLAPPDDSPFPQYEKHYGEEVIIKKLKK